MTDGRSLLLPQYLHSLETKSATNKIENLEVILYLSLFIDYVLKIVFGAYVKLESCG